MKIANLAALSLLLSTPAFADSFVACYTNDAGTRADIVIEDLARDGIGPNQAVTLFEAMKTDSITSDGKSFQTPFVQLTCKNPTKGSDAYPAAISSCTLTLLTQEGDYLYDFDMDRVSFGARPEEAREIAQLFGATAESPFTFKAGRASFISMPETFQFDCQF